MITVNRLAAEQSRVRAELLKAARAGQVTKWRMPALTKDGTQVPIQVAARALRFTISTPTPDRANDIVRQLGWELANYRRNPIVLLDHGMHPVLGFVPIGRCIDMTVTPDALKATVEFDPQEMPISGLYAEMALRKTLAGSFGATSVGFRPIDFDLSSREDTTGIPGFDFNRQELTEFSLVAVPCNPDCGPDFAGPQLAENLVPSSAATRSRLRRLQMIDLI